MSTDPWRQLVEVEAIVERGITSPETGERIAVELFVAVLPASGVIFAKGTHTQQGCLKRARSTRCPERTGAAFGLDRN
jgi:hypothetical protein